MSWIQIAALIAQIGVLIAQFGLINDSMDWDDLKSNYRNLVRVLKYSLVSEDEREKVRQDLIKCIEEKRNKIQEDLDYYLDEFDDNALKLDKLDYWHELGKLISEHRENLSTIDYILNNLYRYDLLTALEYIDDDLDEIKKIQTR